MRKLTNPALSYSEALAAAQIGKDVQLVTRDATGQHFSFLACWLEDGELVHSHPTDPSGADVRAPRDGKYGLDNLLDGSGEDYPDAPTGYPKLALHRVYRYRYDNTPGNVPLDDEQIDNGELGAGYTWAEIAKACGFDPEDEEISITCLTADWSATGQRPWHKAGDYVVTGLVVEGHPFAVIPVDHGEAAEDAEDVA